jgi:hypothetical protein
MIEVEKLGQYGITDGASYHDMTAAVCALTFSAISPPPLHVAWADSLQRCKLRGTSRPAAAGLDVDVRDRPSPLVFGTVG